VADLEGALDTDIAAGSEALARGVWDEARVAFERALARLESAEAYEGLGVAAWWLEDVSTTFDARRRAFRIYRDSADQRGAARVATALASDHLLAGEHAICRGWVQRARRLVEAVEPAPEAGWLAIFEAHLALMVEHDAIAAERASVEAARLGHELAEVDLEMSGLAYQGLALVSQGRVGDGMRLLDEATAAALAGEIRDPDAAASCCCALIYACERVYDYSRAAQWCLRLKEMSTRWSYRLMLSVCRTHYAGVLMWRGSWAEAEAELLTALTALEATRPGEAAEAVVRLAGLRCRQGRFDEAAELFARTEAEPLRMQGFTLGLHGRAELALDLDDARTAADLAERYLRGLGDRNRMERGSGLELLARARSATGELESAEAAARELAALAAEVATEPVFAAACLATGVVASARGDHDAARRWFEDAADHYHRAGGVFEAARARVHLAGALAALDRGADAAREAQAAYRVFHRLGAAGAAAQTAALMRRLAGSAVHPVDLGRAHLTPREVEILRLLARGMSNQLIAGELVLSVRTVERHIGNVYDKLGLTGGAARAAATAFALTHGLT
jgi:LuxR family transcriptional regulator, maltose regulon positive regulatory protein